VVWIKTKNPKARIALGPYLILGFLVSSFQPTIEVFTEVVGS
jgi:prepilin signal peptidase PulO-like enzyme (type II secretory pathway)